MGIKVGSARERLNGNFVLANLLVSILEEIEQQIPETRGILKGLAGTDCAEVIEKRRLRRGCGLAFKRSP
jgi:hypothetical protein